MKEENRQTQGGFSLLEMLIAVTVLGISLLGLAQLLGLAIQQNGQARLDTASMEVARGKLEELKTIYNWQMETGLLSSELTAGLHGPEVVELPNVQEHFGIRRLYVQWLVSDQTIFRKNVQIFVRPTPEYLSEVDTAQEYLEKTTKISTSLTP